MAASTSPSAAVTVAAFSMWRLGTTSTWRGAWGLRSRKASVWSLSRTTVAGTSPATMRQNRQSATVSAPVVGPTAVRSGLARQALAAEMPFAGTTRTAPLTSG